MTCFAYDVLGRQIKRVAKASATCTGTATQVLAYDSKPNGKGLLASLTGINTDASSYSEQYNYNSPFNTPAKITQGSKFSELVYGPNQDRIKHGDSNGRVTKYVGGIYEEVTKGGVPQKIHYIGGIALFVQKPGVNRHEYLHRDHIGSIVAITGDTVNTSTDVQWLSNGAWGERRMAQWNGPLDPTLIPSSTAHGFTDHEHLDAVGLIHMNGRVYDPELGRFLSADPFVQAPYNSQSYNRYSYVFNNPLSFTDPTGYYTAPTEDLTPEITVTGSKEEEDRKERERQQASQMEAMQWSRLQDLIFRFGTQIGDNTFVVPTSDGAGYKVTVDSKKLPASLGAVGVAVGTLTGEGAGAGLLELLVRGPGGVILGSLSLTGSTVQDKNNQYKYVTYTRSNSTGQVYSGRTGGYGTVDQILARRYAGQSHLTLAGFSYPAVDNVSFSRAAIRGREQMLIDFHGGAQSMGGTSANKINGIYLFNPNREYYLESARTEFGSLPNNSPMN